MTSPNSARDNGAISVGFYEWRPHATHKHLAQALVKAIVSGPVEYAQLARLNFVQLLSLNFHAFYDFLLAVGADVESLVSLPQHLRAVSKGAWHYLVRLGRFVIYFSLVLVASIQNLIYEGLAEYLNDLSIFTESSHIHGIVAVNVCMLLSPSLQQELG